MLAYNCIARPGLRNDEIVNWLDGDAVYAPDVRDRLVLGPDVEGPLLVANHAGKALKDLETKLVVSAERVRSRRLHYAPVLVGVPGRIEVDSPYVEACLLEGVVAGNGVLVVQDFESGRKRRRERRHEDIAVGAAAPHRVVAVVEVQRHRAEVRQKIRGRPVAVGENQRQGEVPGTGDVPEDDVREPGRSGGLRARAVVDEFGVRLLLASTRKNRNAEAPVGNLPVNGVRLGGQHPWNRLDP